MHRFAVIGPGAIGTWLACRLSRVGPVLLVGRDPAWLALALAQGVRVRSAEGKRTLAPPSARVRATLRPSGTPEAVFICVKSGDTRAALRSARRLAGPDTPVVSVQNGLTHVGPTLRAIGRPRSVFGACYCAVKRESLVDVRHHAGQMLWLGLARTNQNAVRRARGWLLAAGLDVPAPAREDRVLWTKAIFNAATNPLGALTASPNGALAKAPALWEILKTILAEAQAAARAAGHPPLFRHAERRLRSSCLEAPEQENSMLQDLRAGRPTEADAIAGPILSAARRHGVETPVLRALWRLVKRMELDGF